MAAELPAPHKDDCQIWHWKGWWVVVPGTPDDRHWFDTLDVALRRHHMIRRTADGSPDTEQTP